MYARSKPAPAARTMPPGREIWFDIRLKPQEFWLRPHESMFMEGDDAGSVYEMLEGALCCYSLLADGRRQVLFFSFPGDLVGLVQGDTHRYSTEALSPTRVRSIPRSVLFRTAAERPEMGRKLLQFATGRLAMMEDHFVMLGRKSALEKVASFLLSLARDAGSRDADMVVLEIPMSRADIADYLGLTLETVSRTLTRLKVAGAIDLPQPHRVVIPDMRRLKRLAEAEGNAA